MQASHVATSYHLGENDLESSWAVNELEQLLAPGKYRSFKLLPYRERISKPFWLDSELYPN
jgi:hypothetical protein